MVSRCSISVTGTSSAGKDRRIFDPDDAGADHGQRTRQTVELQHLVAVEDRVLSKGTSRGLCGPCADRDQRIGKTNLAVVSGVGGQADLVGAKKLHVGAGALDRVAHELVLQHLDLVVEGLVQALDKIADRNILLDPVAAPIEAALAPTREVEHGFAQRFRWNGAGMHRDRHQDAGRGRPPAPICRAWPTAPQRAAPRAAADDQHVVVHIAPSSAPERFVAPQQANAIRAANSTDSIASRAARALRAAKSSILIPPRAFTISLPSGSHPMCGPCYEDMT
jgi:hypothetical protein